MRAISKTRVGLLEFSRIRSTMLSIIYDCEILSISLFLMLVVNRAFVLHAFSLSGYCVMQCCLHNKLQQKALVGDEGMFVSERERPLKNL